jgi:hypothetical protein
MREPVIYKFDQTLVGSSYKIKYIGEAAPGVDTTQANWTIYRFTWVTNPDLSHSLGQIQVLNGAWDDRDTLSWS